MSDNKLTESIEDDNSVTMLDVLQVENQLEEDAYAVLGASDDQNCTYNKVGTFFSTFSNDIAILFLYRVLFHNRSIVDRHQLII